MVKAFRQYNKIQAGYSVSLNGETQVETRIKEVKRSSKVLQYLFGCKKVPVTRSQFVGETSYLTAELVSLIENVKNTVQQNHIEDKNREIQNQSR